MKKIIIINRLLDSIPQITRQYIHIISVPIIKNNDLSNFNINNINIIDSKDCHEIFIQNEINQNNNIENNQYNLLSLSPLNYLLDFMRSKTRIGDCRKSFRNALQQLLQDRLKLLNDKEWYHSSKVNNNLILIYFLYILFEILFLLVLYHKIVNDWSYVTCYYRMVNITKFQ